MTDRDRRSELHDAAVAADLERVSQRLEAGDSPHAADNEGFTPLHFAAQSSATECARLLLEAGAAVDARNDHGNTALWIAVFHYRGDGSTLELLLAHGADPMTRNDHGKTRTSWHTIANYDVAKYFRRHGP